MSLLEAPLPNVGRPAGGPRLSAPSGNGTSSHGGGGVRCRVALRCLTVATFLTMAVLSGAETPEYILSAIRSHTTEDVLRALVWVDDDCPFDWDAANEIVDGVFIRSRVRNEIDDGDLFLDVSLGCLQDGTRYIYTIRVRMDRWGLAEPWILDWDWGSFGFGRRTVSDEH